MQNDSPYIWHEVLVAPGRSHAALWRLLLGLVIVAVIVFALNALALGLIDNLGSDEWVRDFMSGATSTGLLLLLACFSFVTIAVGVAARVMQKRSLLSVVGPAGLAVRQFWLVFRFLLILGAAILLLPPYDMGAPLEANLPFGRWLLLLPLSLLGVLVQTSAEEILFRGYVQQSLAARFKSPLVWMILPSVLFGLGHYLPVQAGENAWLIAVWSGVFGVLMADLTARAGTLGPAIAMHLFNNMVALLFIAMPGGLTGLALYLVPFEMSDTEHLRGWLIVDFVTMVLGWLTARVALRR